MEEINFLFYFDFCKQHIYYSTNNLGLSFPDFTNVKGNKELSVTKSKDT